eukprot:898058-Pyramimonas_sp.AAC.1
MSFPPLFSIPLHVSWPLSGNREEPHRRPQWRRSHGGPAQFLHTSHTLLGPIGNPIEGHPGEDVGMSGPS